MAGLGSLYTSKLNQRRLGQSAGKIEFGAISQAERWFKPCVNGDFSFLWESQKFDPHRIKTPDLIEIKFGTVDYVGEMTLCAKFHVNLTKEGFSANR